MKKKIVLITPGQPSVNPRIVKEANALSDAGNEVIVLYCYWIDWAFKTDKELLADVKWKFELIGGAPYNNRLLFWYTKVIQKIFKFLNKWIGGRYGIAEIAQAKGYNQLLKRAKGIKADWYIGHNLGALAIAVKAAKYNNAKAAFDFEDYHRGETEDKLDVNRINYLENKYVPILQYISSASPLITDCVRLDFPAFKNPIITLLNSFSKKNQPVFIKKASSDKSLNLFWFSQMIGPGRGLETALAALKQLGDDTIHLTLVGGYTKEIEADFLKRVGKMRSNLHFIGIVDPDKIPIIAATMDIGLALEQAIPYNRDVCLTNKVFIYLQAGNALILTNTKAQMQFQQQYQVGDICSIDDVETICLIIKKYKTDIDLLNRQREQNWRLANEFLNWENESKKLVGVID